MTGYRINPAGVQTVLNTTKTDAEQFGTILTPLEGWVQQAAEGTGGSGAVVPALESFFSNQGPLLDTITRRIGAALTGAYNATNAYMKGDLEMVGTYQQAAVAAGATPPADRGGQGRTRGD